LILSKLPDQIFTGLIVKKWR